MSLFYGKPLEGGSHEESMGLGTHRCRAVRDLVDLGCSAHAAVVFPRRIAGKEDGTWQRHLLSRWGYLLQPYCSPGSPLSSRSPVRRNCKRWDMRWRRCGWRCRQWVSTMSEQCGVLSISGKEPL